MIQKAQQNNFNDTRVTKKLNSVNLQNEWLSKILSGVDFQ